MGTSEAEENSDQGSCHCLDKGLLGWDLVGQIWDSAWAEVLWSLAAGGCVGGGEEGKKQADSGLYP